MNIDAAFPSAYWKAADLNDKPVKVTMSKVVMEDIGGDHKPILYFEDNEKGLVLNKTNANNIKVLYGADTKEWIGKEIVLFPTVTDFQGRTVDCVRVRGAKGATKKELDDEVPF